MKQQATNRIVGADTVRAMATLGVFAFHQFAFETSLKEIDSAALRVLRGGYLGVPAFFVLSGFLLSMSFWKAHRAGVGMPDLKVYAGRRMTRILPEYFVCVVIMTLLSGALASKWGYLQLAACLTFTNTLLPPLYTPKWDPPLWSISIEMGFYLLLPLVAIGLFRFRSRTGARLYLAAIIGLIAVGQWLLLGIAPGLERAVGDANLFRANSTSTTQNMVMLFSHFLIGVVAADVYLGRPLRIKASRFNRHDLLVMAATAWIGSTLAAGTRLPGFVYMQFMWPTFSILIAVLLVSLPQAALLRPLIDGRFMRLTATLSYGIYIWHVPVLVGLKQVWPSTPDGRISIVALYSLTALACTYAVAAISYRVIGKPALDWLRAREAGGAEPRLTTPATCRAAA